MRDAVRAGATIAIVPTGGTEQNGPHMATGKHNLIVRHCAGEIARRLGNALVAPVLAYVPEGSFDPPTDNMALPGTIGVSEPTFAAILAEAATSLALAGFTLICFIGDHGLSQRAQASVAATLTQRWDRRGIRVADIDRYYAGNGEEEWLHSQGYSDAEIGLHAGLLDTAELMAVAPEDIRAELAGAPAPGQRVRPAPKATRPAQPPRWAPSFWTSRSRRPWRRSARSACSAGSAARAGRWAWGGPCPAASGPSAPYSPGSRARVCGARRCRG